MSDEGKQSGSQVEVARGIQVPFQADSIASPEIRYGVGENESNQVTCLVVWISDASERVGRVTFEEFDAVHAKDVLFDAEH